MAVLSSTCVSTGQLVGWSLVYNCARLLVLSLLSQQRTQPEKGHGAWMDGPSWTHKRFTANVDLVGKWAVLEVLLDVWVLPGRSLYDILNLGIIITCSALINVIVVLLIVINDPNICRQMHVTRQNGTLGLNAICHFSQSVKSAAWQPLYHSSGPGRGPKNRLSVPRQRHLDMSWTN